MLFIFPFVKLRLLSSSGIEKITEQETAHPSLQQLSQLTGAAVAANGALENITVSHEIEERATALVQGEEDDEDNSSEVADKEFVDQGAFHSEPVIVDVSGTHIKVLFLLFACLFSNMLLYHCKTPMFWIRYLFPNCYFRARLLKIREMLSEQCETTKRMSESF